MSHEVVVGVFSSASAISLIASFPIFLSSCLEVKMESFYIQSYVAAVMSGWEEERCYC